MIKAGEEEILEISAIIQFENLTSHLQSKRSKYRTYRRILLLHCGYEK